MNDAAPRLCGHWLHGLSSKVKASIDGCVMHDNRVELAGAFGRFCLSSTASGMSLVGSFAWTGRALQAECEEMEGVGLAHLDLRGPCLLRLCSWPSWISAPCPIRGEKFFAPLADEIRTLLRALHRRMFKPNRNRPHREATHDWRDRQ
jgi:hypothetical protein